jgi:hypothetical protein
VSNLIECITSEANIASGEERLPIREGWKPINRIDGFSIAQAVLQISLLTPEKAKDTFGHS